VFLRGFMTINTQSVASHTIEHDATGFASRVKPRSRLQLDRLSASGSPCAALPALK
jgi:hypothetical protein